MELYCKRTEEKREEEEIKDINRHVSILKDEALNIYFLK